MKLLPASFTQTGTMTLRPPDVEEPINVERRTEAGMQLVRWRHVSLVFQGAMNSLDPVKRVEHQIAEAIYLHERPASASDVRARIGELLTTVGLTPALGRRYAAPAVGRPAPARDDRARARVPAVARDRRRADHGARRGDAGADPGAARAACASSSAWR